MDLSATDTANCKTSRVMRVILAAFSLLLYQCTATSQQQEISALDNYSEQWQQVTDLEREGRIDSANSEAREIYQLAQQSGNTAQLVKALLHLMKYRDTLEEESFRKNFEQLNAEIESADIPLKQLLYSIRGQMLWQYYSNSRYRFAERTATSNVELDNVLTWDLNTIVEQTLSSYRASLQDSEALKAIPLSQVEEIILVSADSRSLRPTLYDLLASRALQFFSGSEPDLTRPALTFTLDKAEYFADAEDFIQQTITTPDELATKFYAVRVLQDLLAFHHDDENRDAFVDFELLRLGFIHTYSTVSDKGDLYLEALLRLKDQLGNNPVFTRVSHQIARYYVNTAEQWQPGAGSQEHYDDLVKAMAVCDEAIAAHPQFYGAQHCKRLQENQLTAYLYLGVEDANPSETPFKTLLNYKNVDHAFVKIVTLDFDNFRQNIQRLNETDLINYLHQQPQVYAENFALKLPVDYREHATELPLPGIARGYYALLIADNAAFDPAQGSVSFADFWVTDIALLMRNRSDYSEYELFIRQRSDGTALAQAEVNLYEEEYNASTRDYESKLIETLTADDEGYLKITHQRDDSQRFKLEIVNGQDRYKPYQTLYRNRPHGQNESQINTHFFLDRGIYRPGQTVYFKGLITRSSGRETEILPNHTTTVYLFDANHQQKAELRVKSNEYGSYSGSFELPQGELNGIWFIRDNYGTREFSVEEYKRPKFEVTFAKLEGNYRLNDTVQLKGSAQALAGYRIDGAEVHYTVKRAPRYPSWRYSRYSSFFPQGSEQIIQQGDLTTDENGEFSLEFDTLPDPAVMADDDAYFSFTVSVDVTDLTGETRSATTSVYAGYKSLVVDINLPERLKQNDDTRYLIKTTNLAGTETAAKGEFKLTKLGDYPRLLRDRSWDAPDQQILTKEHYVELFPHDIYDDEKQPSQLARESVVSSFTFDTAEETAVVFSEIGELEPGHYRVEMSATDPYGETVSFEKYLVVYQVADGAMPVNEYDWFEAIDDIVQPGDTARLLIGSAANDVHVLYEIEHDGTIVQRETLRLNNEQRLIEIPVEEKHRGNFQVHFSYVKDNRAYTRTHTINVPFDNKKLTLEFTTFRDKLLPGQQEQWQIAVSGPDQEKIAAELLAGMYDASLDAFRANPWNLSLHRNAIQAYHWYRRDLNEVNRGRLVTLKSYVQTNPDSLSYERLNLFGFDLSGAGMRLMSLRRRGAVMPQALASSASPMPAEAAVAADAPAPAPAPEMLAEAEDRSGEYDVSNKADAADNAVTGGEDVQIRSNFAETAFFYPQLQTDEDGRFIFSFTVPESLTRWKFQSLAHTQELQTATLNETVTTQKDLMITAFAPRFLRENDQLVFTAKVTNLSDHIVQGDAQLLLFDALTLKPVDAAMDNDNPTMTIDIQPGQSTQLNWPIQVPAGLQAVTYRIIAKAGEHSDGEEMTLPVLLNSKLVTESLPLPVNGNSEKTFQFDKLLQSENSSTLRSHKLTLEFTSNPVWYAIQALPYMMEYPYECSEQTFNRIYANSIGAHIANSDPRIKQVFEIWRNYQPDALLSNLEKNQELKNVMLQETPWVLDAQDESERKRRVATLFDLNRMQNELDRALTKLGKMQLSNGGWPWFEGGPDNRYITQYIAAGFGHMQKIGIALTAQSDSAQNMLVNSIAYLDARLKEDYQRLLQRNADLTKKQITRLQLHYLYTRSFFSEIAIPADSQTAFDFYLEQAKTFWLDESFYGKGMIALAHFRYGDSEFPQKILQSLRETAIQHEELGMYWKLNSGWYWYEAPIETQALLIEAFSEIDDDREAVEQMRIWLLKNKQTNDWKTTKATAEASYALLLEGGAARLADPGGVLIQLGDITLNPEQDPNLQQEAGTGYFKTSWSGSDIKPEFGSVKISKTTDGIAWGALYWQYFEQLDKITSADTPVSINKQLFLESSNDRGAVLEPIDEQTPLKPGDRIKVRVEIVVDRDMEFVHMKDMRASAFEPENVFSGYRHQDGLWYYESTRDAATHFFIDYLGKGTYVFEYPLRVTHEGNFSNGITELQSMYAPEFSSHSEGVRVTIGQNNQ